MDKQMPPGYRTDLRHLLFATLIGAIAVVLRAVIQPLLGDALPFVVAYPAIVLAALLWGVLPGIVAATVCGIGVWVPGIPPTIAESQQAPEFAWFALSAVISAVLCGRYRSRSASAASAGPHGPRETPLGAWLRAVLWGAVFVPLSAFVAASWWSLDRAEAASSVSLIHASDLAFRQAQRTFSVAQEIATRADQASQFPSDEVRAREADIHLRLSDMAAGLTAVVNANLWDASGSCLARSDRYPVDPKLTIADRPYFQERKASLTPVGVSDVLVGRQTAKPVINVAMRRSSPDGTFNGVVTVTLTPDFFIDYYRTLAHEEPTLATFALVKSDGAVLARWPDNAGDSDLSKASPLVSSVATGQDSGHMTIASDSGRGTQMVMYRRVGTLPVYVITGMSRTAMLASWARFVCVLAAILLPTTVGLVYVTWVALIKTRKETAVSTELQNQIHARAEAERRMLEAQKLETLSFVTGSVAHDFNNLLAVITSSLHVLKIRRPETADDKTLAAISRSVQSGVRLTRQLLSFSKKQALRPEVVRLQTWLPTADTLMRSTLGSTATWTSVVEDDTRHVKVDTGELELALINLVLNAKLAMPKGGSLSVHVSNDREAPKTSPKVIVCVTDTGDGIPPEVLPKVFEPFFTTRQRGVGSGLGLTQVQGFCIQSGGHVSIKSVPGEGTSVCLHLPASNEEHVQAVEATPEPVGRLEAELLLVEDNDEVGRMTEQMLRTSGLTVVRVSSADAALQYLGSATSRPDVVLSDIAMPGTMNGIALALELRRRYPDIPVMLNTGYAEQIEEATARGLRVFQKPVAPAVLLAELRSLIVVQRNDLPPFETARS